MGVEDKPIDENKLKISTDEEDYKKPAQSAYAVRPIYDSHRWGGNGENAYPILLLLLLLF